MRAALNAGSGGVGHFRPGLLPQAALALLVAVAAAGALIGLTLASKQIAFVIGAVFVLIVAFVLSGNPRLFALWCLLFTAPLGIKKAFLVHAHMGGAPALTIDGDDVFLAILLLFILRDAAAHRRALRFAPTVVVCWGALIALGVIDVVAGPVRTLPFLEIVRMLKCYLLFFVIINEVVRIRQFLHAIAAIVCGIAMQGAITVVQYLYKANLGLQFLGEPGAEATTSATKSVYLGTVDIYRAGGLFEHPNLLAGYMALLLPICIALLFSRINPLAKAALGAVVVLGLIAMVITLSRSGWLSFAAGFVLLLLYSMLHQKMRLRYVLVRVLVIMGMIAAVGGASGAIIRRFTQSDPGAFKFRWDMMYSSFDMIMAHPLFGLGLNTFVAHFPEYADPPGREAVNAKFGEFWPVVHNSYLVTWTEQGTIGLIFLLGLYACTLWTAARTGKYVLDDRLHAINVGAACGIIAIMVDGMSSFFIDESASERVFFMVVGLIFALHYWTRANRPRYAGIGAVARAPVGARPLVRPDGVQWTEVGQPPQAQVSGMQPAPAVANGPGPT